MKRRRFLARAALAVAAARMASAAEGAGAERRLFLCGDVMTGRGIDQALPHPGDPRLYEPAVEDANEYVALAEAANGPILRPLGFADIWGEALAEIGRRRPDARIVNLETAVTRSGRPYPKGINYRMSPQNAACLQAAGIDCCGLANNHVLDWGREGLLETLATLGRAGIATAGAGRTAAEAGAPAVLALPGGGRVIVFALGHASSGIPRGWAATADEPGIDLLADLSAATAEGIARRVRAVKAAGDVVVASIHWGGNWGYEVPAEQTAFAHALIAGAGVDVVHGHSSHHAKAIEVHGGRLVLYGCGDFLNDYEGIGGEERYRGDLVLGYFPRLDAGTGELCGLDMAPFRVRGFRLCRATRAEAGWLAGALSRAGERFGTAVEEGADGALRLRC